MHQLIDKKNKLFIYILLLIILSTINNRVLAIKQNSIIKINDIKVSGLSNENNLKIIKDLNLIFFQNIFFIDEENFKDVLKNNNLIESFNVQKIYPNIIDIKIKEAELLAIINHNSKKYFIGSNGKFIDYQKIRNLKKKLPYVFGKVNAQDFINLKKNIDNSKLDFEKIESFYFFPSNRWDIKTKEGLLVKFPEKNLVQSLDFVHKIINNVNFINNKVIDLRIPNHMITMND